MSRNYVKPKQKLQRKGKRKRKSRYITGTHNSPKANKPIDYRSSWELAVCLYLDHSSNVVSYSYETLIIPYISNIRTGKIRRYFPDFLVLYADGTQILVEVKRKDKLTDPMVMKKAEAGRKWAAEQPKQTRYELWTNDHILAFKKMNEVWEIERQKSLLKEKALLGMKTVRRPKVLPLSR